jgi:O-antigen/teichoic acid export membrane protein
MNLFKASISTLFTRVILFILSIISSVLVVRLIGAEGKGIVSVFQTFFSMVLTISYFSVGTGLVFYGLKENNLKTYYDAGVNFSIILSTILLLLGLLFKDSIQSLYFKEIPEEYIYLGLGLFYLNTLFFITQSYSRARKKPLLYNMANFLENIVYVITVIIYWFWVKNISAFDILIAHALGKLTSVGYTYIAFKLVPAFKLNNFTNIFKMVKFGAKEHIGVISQNLNLRLDILIMGALLAKEEIGYYSIAVMIAQMVWYIPESVTVFLYPKIAGQNDNNESAKITVITNRITLFVSFFVATAIFLTGSFLIPFMYGEDFTAALLPMNILLVGTVGLSAQKIITKYFSGIGKPLITSYTAIFGLVINLPLLYFLIPSYGIIGASMATAITYFSMGIVSVLIFKKVASVNYSLLDLLFIKKSDVKLLVDQINPIVFKKNK